MIHYLDTSALVKAYVDEERSEEVRELLEESRRGAASRLYVCRLTYPETLSAIVRRENRREIPPGDARVVMARAIADFTGPERPYQIIEPAAAVVNEAAGLVVRRRLRGFDAVQLAAALALHQAAPTDLVFAAADQRLLDAAAAEQLPTLDLR